MDLLKSLAITGVILIHVSAGGYSHPVGSFHWLSALFWGSVSRASVPIFLMVTGALMLTPAGSSPFGSCGSKKSPGCWHPCWPGP